MIFDMNKVDCHKIQIILKYIFYWIVTNSIFLLKNKISTFSNVSVISSKYYYTFNVIVDITFIIPSTIIVNIAI